MGIGVPVLIGLFAGVVAHTYWERIQLFLHGGSFGIKDPQFGFDNAFYLYDLPFIQAVLGFVSAVLLISFIAAFATCYLYGAFRVNGREVRLSKPARVQLAVTAALYIAVQGASIWFDQYATLSHTRSGPFIGASYTDMNARSCRAVLTGIAFIVAALFVVTVFTGRLAPRIP